MLIGVDFDNTIVCYDGLFHRVAVEQGLIPQKFPRVKVKCGIICANVGRKMLGPKCRVTFTAIA